MNSYKIVASDLDGTLLNSEGVMSKENLEAISSLCASGVLFVPASGRTLCEIPDDIKDNPNVRYIIHSSGAAVFDKITGKRISFCFPKELFESSLEILRNADCHLTIRRHGKLYTSKETMNEESFCHYRVWAAHSQLLVEFAELIENFACNFIADDAVEMISAFFHDDEELTRVKETFLKNPEINVASACPHNIELTYAKAGKGNALRALADSLSIPIEETIAMGDSENDLPMIKAAGIGLATKDATESLKRSANEVICSNDEHVAKYVYERYFQ